MSAKIAEQLAIVADLYTQLGEATQELSALYDAASAKSGKAGDDGAASKVSGRSGKAGVASKKGGGDDDDLPDPKAAAGKSKPAGKSAKKKVTEADVRAMAKKVIEKHGKEKVTEILGGKLADVDEDDYADKLAELEEAFEAEVEGEDDDV